MGVEPMHVDVSRSYLLFRVVLGGTLGLVAAGISIHGVFEPDPIIGIVSLLAGLLGMLFFATMTVGLALRLFSGNAGLEIDQAGILDKTKVWERRVPWRAIGDVRVTHYGGQRHLVISIRSSEIGLITWIRGWPAANHLIIPERWVQVDLDDLEMLLQSARDQYLHPID